MLSLKTTSSQRWLDQAAANVPELLIDHAHCEKKAAGTAMNLLFAYVENVDLCRAMTEIVQEELAHFHMVLDILAAREIPFCKLSPSSYGRKLNDLVSKQEPRRAVDRLLVAGLIEARSCERFEVLAAASVDGELSSLYRGLCASERGHFRAFVALAESLPGVIGLDARWSEMLEAEGRLIASQTPSPTMHGGA